MNSYFSLPTEFGIGLHETLVYFYSNNRSSVHNKVIFTTNMICLLQHGTKQVQTAAGKEVITNKDVLILGCGSTLMSESLAANGKYEAILIFFSNKALTDFCIKYSVTIGQKPGKKTILKLVRDEFLTNYSTSLQLLKGQQHRQLNELKVEEILFYLSVNYPDAFEQLLSQAFATATDVKLRQVIETTPVKGLTIEELAFLCNMSVSTFKRHFAGIYNTTPQRYFNRLKMEHAKKLLLLKHRPSAIFEQLGYETLATFSNEFRKYTGLSPRQFQQKNEPLAQLSEPIA